MAFSNGLLVHKQGRTVKAVARGNGLIEGYLISFGNNQDTDLEGQWFTKRTDLRLDWFKDRPVLYHHGLDGAVGLDPIGRIKAHKIDDIGLWIQAQLNMADTYGREVYDMVSAKQFGWSSGSVDHLVKIAPDGEILVWPLIEGSVTPTPAQPAKTTVRALKSILGAQDEVGRFLISMDGLKALDEQGEMSMYASKAAKRKAILALRSMGIHNPTKAEIDAMAEEEDFAMMEGEETAFLADDDLALLADEDAFLADDDLAFAADDDLALLADDDLAFASDEDAFLADEDAFLADDDLAFAADEDAFLSDEDALLADDDLALLSDEDALLADEDFAFASARRSRRSRGRKSLIGGGSIVSQNRQIAALKNHIARLEGQESPGQRMVGMKAYGGLSVTRDAADQPGAYARAFKAYIRYGEARMSAQDRTILQKGVVIDRNPADSYTSAGGTMKALNIGNAASVGFGVPDDFVSELNKNIMVQATMASECKVRTTTSDTILQPDLITTDARRAYPGSAKWPGESPANQAESAVTELGLAQIQLPIHVMLVSTTATYSALEDVAFDLQATLTEQFSEVVAVEYETLLWSGNGQGKMRGIVNDTRVSGSASTGVSTVGGYVASGNATNIVSGDPLIDLTLHMPPGYRARGKWYMNSNTAAVVRKLKDGQGRYLWGDDTGLNQGVATSLLGRPIVYNEFASDIGAGAFPIIYGDLSRAYLIGKRVEFSVRRFDDSAYAVQDQVLFLGRARIGGQVIQPAALKVLKVALS